VEERAGMNTYRPIVLGFLLPALVMPAGSADAAPLNSHKHVDRPAMEYKNREYPDFPSGRQTISSMRGPILTLLSSVLIA